MDSSILLLALSANFCFALGSQFFTYFSQKVGATWMNWFKASAAQVCFITCIVLGQQFYLPPVNAVLSLMLSGFIGLGLGDVLLLYSFKVMGPGRTLMLFAFQPIFIGTASYYLFGQDVDATRFWGIFFFILCIFIFSLENFRKDRTWGLQGIFIALGGMLLDASGVLITRTMYEGNAELSPLLTNFYRTNGAILFFILLKIAYGLKGKKLNLIGPFIDLVPREKAGVIFGSVLGTFVSLSLYLTALQKAHLASLSGVAITGTIFSALFECIYQKKWPSRYLITAFLSFLIGMKIILF